MTLGMAAIAALVAMSTAGKALEWLFNVVMKPFRRLERIERALFGDEDNREGLVATVKAMRTERTEEIAAQAAIRDALVVAIEELQKVTPKAEERDGTP